MAFAYIKFVEGPFSGNKYRIPVSKIEYKFNGIEFDDKKKYFVSAKDGNRYKAQIIFLANTEEDLDQLVKTKRPRLKPAPQLDTASSQSDLNDNSTAAVNYTPKEKENEQMKYDSQLQIKLEKLGKPVDEGKGSNNERKSNVLKKSKTEIRKGKNLKNFSKVVNMSIQELNSMIGDIESKNKSYSQAASKSKEENAAPNDSEISTTEVKSSKENLQDCNLNLQENIESAIEMSPPLIENINDDPKRKQDKDYVLPKQTKNSAGDIEQKNIPALKVVSNEGFHNENVCKTKFKDLKNKNESLKKENEKLRKKNENLKTELGKEKENSNEYRALNIKLQKILVEKHEDKEVVEKQIQDAANEIQIDHRMNFVPIGRQRDSDNKVHIGRKIWIDIDKYSRITSITKSPGLTAGYILIAVYGEETLMRSTLTGRQSNKSGKGKEKVNQLNPTALLACKDLYSHWLKTVYEPSLSDEEKESYNYLIEMGNFNEYCSKKISYLKRPAQSSTSKKIEISNVFKSLIA